MSQVFEAVSLDFFFFFFFSYFSKIKTATTNYFKSEQEEYCLCGQSSNFGQAKVKMKRHRIKEKVNPVLHVPVILILETQGRSNMESNFYYKCINTIKKIIG